MSIDLCSTRFIGKKSEQHDAENHVDRISPYFLTQQRKWEIGRDGGREREREMKKECEQGRETVSAISYQFQVPSK